MSQQSLESILSKAKSGSSPHLAQLIDLGRRSGFSNFLNRKQIWPFLLGIDPATLPTAVYEWQGELDKNSSDYQQLQKDAERSLSTMKTFQNITNFHLRKRQRDVLKILDSFFAKNAGLKYIQGFHDVASIFLVIFGSSPGYYMMEKAGRTYFRDYLTKDIGKIGHHVSQILLELLVRRDSQFQRIFECFAEMQLLPFIISWVLTWFSHVFTSVKTIGRMWDYILCTGPHGIVYVTAGVILSTKGELLAQCEELDHASIQMFYQEKTKKESIDIAQAITIAIQLERQFPLQQLSSYNMLDSDSMMRSSVFQLQLDIHRRVKEHSLARSKRLRNQILILLAVLILICYYWLRVGKK